MNVPSYHPGATLAQIKETSRWKLKIAPDEHETEPPALELLRISREECDPTVEFFAKQ
jgi:hypothetical protein